MERQDVARHRRLPVELIMTISTPHRNRRMSGRGIGHIPAVLAVAALLVAPAPAAHASPTNPAPPGTTYTSDTDDNGDARFVVTNNPVGFDSPGVVAGTQYVQASDCGPRRFPFDDALHGDLSCWDAQHAYCPLATGAPPNPTKHIMLYRVYETATRSFVRADIACDIDLGPALPDPKAVHDEAQKRAPEPRAKTGGNKSLINAAIVFYVAKANADEPDLTNPVLKTFALGGRQISVRLHLTKTVWSWEGKDGPSDTFTADAGGDVLGKPYDKRISCESDTECSEYISHVYPKPGAYKVTLTAHYTGTFTFDGGTQQFPIPGDVFRADTVGHPLTIVQARSVLVDSACTPPGC
jgi:hypothetical protein